MSAEKPKLYFLLGNTAFLEPLSGDRVNEMNLIRAMSKHFDVYYNNVLVDPNTDFFGSPDKPVALPDKVYDLHYVRANREIFLQLPSPKIWFATPYFADCYAQADAVATMTDAWHRRMANLKNDPWLCALMGVEGEVVVPKSLILTRQVIAHETLKPDAEKIGKIRENLDGKLLLGHFGRVVTSNFPHHLMAAFEAREVKEKFKISFVGKLDTKFKHWFSMQGQLPIVEIASLIAACDATVYNQDEQGHIAGSLKVMESMALGVPVISPRLEARELELGEGYPYFWSPVTNSKQVTNKLLKSFQERQPKEHRARLKRRVWLETHLESFFDTSFSQEVDSLVEALLKFAQGAKQRETVGSEIKLRSQAYSTQSVGENLRNQLMNLL